MEILNFTISPFYPELPVKKQTVINTLNPHSYCVSKKDKFFEAALLNSDYLLPDGVGIVYAAKILKGEKIKKIAGYDIFLYLMRELDKTKGCCFFLGASEKTLQLISNKIKKDFPNVKVLSYSPPYKAQFSKNDSYLMCKAVNEVAPDVLFVGMTAPKQEKWVYQHKDQINAQIICSIGAVFDFYAGTVKRPSRFWINLGLEWLPRFLKEPRRLAERNLISTPKFILTIINERFKRK